MEKDRTYQEAFSASEAPLFTKAVNDFMAEISNKGIGIRPAVQQDRLTAKIAEYKAKVAEEDTVLVMSAGVALEVDKQFLFGMNIAQETKEMKIAGDIFPGDKA